MLSGLIQGTSYIFDVLLWPFGYARAWPALLVWSTIAGVLALLSYKVASNQKAIAAAQDRIAMHLVEIRLFRHDVRIVLRATLDIFGQNARYLLHSLRPMLVMFVPMTLLLTQLEARYAFVPEREGAVALLRADVDLSRAKVLDLTWALPDGVKLDAPPVRTADGSAFLRLRAETPGDHDLALSVGGKTEIKRWTVGGPPRESSPLRARSWEALLYPGEPALPADSPLTRIELRPPERDFDCGPDGETGVLAWFFGLSFVAGFALRKPLGVTF